MGNEMSNGLLLLIILLSAASAVLAGMAVFSNSRPVDNRVNQVLNEIEDLKGIMAQLQKSFLTLERKQDKEQKEGRQELKEILEKIAVQLERMAQ